MWVFWWLNAAWLPLFVAASSEGGELFDPDDVFAPSFNRPRLQIVRPENGAVLESSLLAIELQVQGYDVPSLLRDSKVCIGLASGDRRVQESCFEQTGR